MGVFGILNTALEQNKMTPRFTSVGSSSSVEALRFHHCFLYKIFADVTCPRKRESVGYGLGRGEGGGG